MVFTSILFIFVFLPLFIITYKLVSKKLKNLVLLIFSIAFYAWGAPKFVFLLLGSLIINYFIVDKIYSDTKRSKLFLVLSVIINVGLLAYFKYANFFVDNFNAITTSLGFNSFSWVKIALPIGISFFTFQSLTYTIDVYRKVHKPLAKLSDYLLYIIMFPQLIAGPIVRFNTIADDIIDREKNETLDNVLYGINRFVIGLAKKVLIANVLAKQVDAIYAMPVDELGTALLWIAVIGYSFQIYFDFSGYSDMAIGLGKMMGFKFPENFNNPYVSTSITDFWRRWHITLGEWMKDYLYIPLGGNKVNSNSRLYLNLIIVFLISGFWHGAEWSFVIWGAWHGLFLILDRIFLIKVLKSIGKIPSVLFTYFIGLFGWVLFRTEDFGLSLIYFKKMFSYNPMPLIEGIDVEFITILGLAVLFSFATLFKFGKQLENYFFYKEHKLKGSILLSSLALVLFLVSAAYITSSDFNPFIYFRF